MGPQVHNQKDDYKYLMVVIDHFSGWVEAYPLINKSNEAVWAKFRNDFVPRHGSPRVIITDQGAESNPEFTFQNRLALQSETFQKAARATEESRKYNKARINKRATANEIKAGDHVILKANEPVSLTSKWDYGYIVTKINGLVVDIFHPESGANMQVHREKVVLVDPDIAWEEITPRPRRQRQKVFQEPVRKRRDSVPRNACASRRNSVAAKPQTAYTPTPGPSRQADPTFVVPKRPHRDSMCSENTISKRTRSQGCKRPASPDQYYPVEKRWRPEQTLLLDFVCCYFSKMCI